MALIFGTTGDDKDPPIPGTPEADEIHALEGNDRIFGGDGNDRIRGDDGRDTLHGGAGADRFILAKASQSTKGQGHDVILHSSSAQGDRIDLSRISSRSGFRHQKCW